MSRRILAGPLELRLALRLLAGRTSGLLSSTSRAALAATALGVAALGIGMALLTGYREDLTRKLVGGSAAILVYATDDAEEPAAAAATLAGVPGVAGVEPVAYLTGVIAADGREVEVTVRGGRAGNGPFAAPDEAFERGADGAWGALVGAELAERLGVAEGAPLRLTVLAFDHGAPRFAFRTLRVRGTFSSGFSEFDRGWLAVDRAAVAGAPGTAAAIWELSVADPLAARGIAEKVRERLGDGYLVLDWRDLNRELFAALELQQRALFVLLGLIVLVATFNVASTLVVLVRERRRDFGVLAAVGLAPARLGRAFLLVGLALGGAGAAIGLAVAAVTAEVVTRFELLRFDPGMAEIYFLSSVPLRLGAADALAIGALALGVSLASSWLPARRAARIDPAAALRFE
jgi:lipoprotein-releasing system permease protein